MMRKITLFLLFSALASVIPVLAAPAVRISDLTGDVQIRRGLEENWQPAAAGMLLENVDTILSLEGSVVLDIQGEVTFHLGSNAILDIGDLRRITKQELFLYLMSEKVDRIEPRKKRKLLRLGNVSVVHGTLPVDKKKFKGNKKPAMFQKEFNGAMALYEQNYFANAILKLHKMQVKYPWVNDCGRPDYYLARSFEALNEPGQAFDAYEKVIKRARKCNSPDAEERVYISREAIDRLNEGR